MTNPHELIFEILRASAVSESPEAFWTDVLKAIQSATGSSAAAVFAAVDGSWQQHTGSDTASGTTASTNKPPLDLLSEVADSGQTANSQNWSAIRIRSGGKPQGQSETPTVVAVLNGDWNELDTETLTRIVESLQHGLRLVQQNHIVARKADRLQAIIDLSRDWNQKSNIPDLLEEIASAASRLMGSERATIFLWDRSTKSLVGRPALGVENNELHIPDNTGVVGQVIRDGRPRRAASNDTTSVRDTISEDVDEMLDFQTRNLVCVPLNNRRGKTIGAFELINRIAGNFTSQDEIDLAEFATLAAAAIEDCQNYQELLSNQKSTEPAGQESKLIGDSPAMDEIRDRIARVAKSELAVMVLGENGTGKDVASRMIHEQSGRAGNAYLAVNCAAISGTLLESELFGHEKGAFTDATESRAGKFEAADGGTLFLDEVAELSTGAQAKLLRVLEEKTIVRVGGMDPISADVRVVAATNQDLPAKVRAREFREDLFFRLNVVTIMMPPLRDRVNDIDQLANHFLAEFCTAANRDIPEFSTKAGELLKNHKWPGNVRELRNLMERIAYLCPDSVIDAEALMLSSESISTNVAENLPLTEATKRFQVEYIEHQIQMANGNMTAAAKRLGLHRSNLYRKMNQLGLSTDDD